MTLGILSLKDGWQIIWRTVGAFHHQMEPEFLQHLLVAESHLKSDVKDWYYFDELLAPEVS